MGFDQFKGWNGRSYVEALQFCGSMSGYKICRYNAISPLGPDSEPMGGHKEEVKGSWIPILDSANDWVQVGNEHPCIRYSNEHQKPPEEITRHVICHLLDERGEDDGDIPPNAILPAGVSSDEGAESS